MEETAIAFLQTKEEFGCEIAELVAHCFLEGGFAADEVSVWLEANLEDGT